MTCSIQSVHCQDIGQEIIVCIYTKSQCVEVFMEFLHHSPFEGEQFQLVGRVVRFGLSQTTAGVGNDSICTIIMSLVEDSPLSRPTSIGFEFKRPGEICISKDRCHGAQALQVIKGPLAPAIPCKRHFLLACIFT